MTYPWRLSTPRRQRFDVVVLGGGAGGVAAAVGAAQAGARTALVERQGFLGGAATASQILAYCGFYTMEDQPRQVVDGVGGQVLAELQRLGLSVAPARMRSGGWIVRLDVEPVKLALDRLALKAGIELFLHAQFVASDHDDGTVGPVLVSDFEGLVELEARAYVDATGHACLARACGVPARRLGEVEPGTTVDRECLAQRIASYNQKAEYPMTRPDGGVLMQVNGASEFWWTSVDLDLPGVSAQELAHAETLGRERTWRELEVLRQIPGFARARITATGPQVGMRESPRVRSREDVRQGDATAGRTRADGIARATWPMERHEGPGRVRWEPIGGDRYFDVPWGALRPPGLDNLWLAGRVVGSDVSAYASIRVMGTAFATGHAAGVSAALGATQASTVRTELQRQNAIV